MFPPAYEIWKGFGLLPMTDTSALKHLLSLFSVLFQAFLHPKNKHPLRVGTVSYVVWSLFSEPGTQTLKC